MYNDARKWQIITAQLDPTRGSEQSGIRPVLIVSTEAVNTRLAIVAVNPLTTLRPGRRIYSNEVFLPANAAGQPNDSLLLIHQARAISKERLMNHSGDLTDAGLREQVNSVLRKHFDLEAVFCSAPVRGIMRQRNFAETHRREFLYGPYAL